MEAGLGGPERHLGDYCMLLNGLGRFQNALEPFQEAPERESLIFHWFWKVLGGGTQGPRHPRAEIFRPPKTPKSKKNTKPKTRYRYRYKYRYRYITKHEKNTLARLRASAVADKPSF